MKNSNVNSEWLVEYLPHARRQLKSLSVDIRERLIDSIEKKLLKEPRRYAERLVGPEQLWKFRVGTYRILFEMIDKKLVILVVEIGHRREIYR